MKKSEEPMPLHMQLAVSALCWALHEFINRFQNEALDFGREEALRMIATYKRGGKRTIISDFEQSCSALKQALDDLCGYDLDDEFAMLCVRSKQCLLELEKKVVDFLAPDLDKFADSEWCQLCEKVEALRETMDEYRDPVTGEGNDLADDVYQSINDELKAEVRQLLGEFPNILERLVEDLPGELRPFHDLSYQLVRYCPQPHCLPPNEWIQPRVRLFAAKEFQSILLGLYTARRSIQGTLPDRRCGDETDGISLCGRPLELAGRKKLILRCLTEASEPCGIEEFAKYFPDRTPGADVTSAESRALRRDLVSIRETIRQSFGLRDEDNPIPTMSGGQQTGRWILDWGLLSRAFA